MYNKVLRKLIASMTSVYILIILINSANDVNFLEYLNSSSQNSEYEMCIFENNVYGICTCKHGQVVLNNRVVCQGK